MNLVENNKSNQGLQKQVLTFLIVLLFLALQACSDSSPGGLNEGSEQTSIAGSGVEEAQHDEEGDEAQVELDSAARDLIPIVTETIYPQPLPITISAPGEVRFNEYRSAVVSPLIDATVVERLATLGEHVEVSQALVTLVSVEIAQAQGDFDIAAREWKRVGKLGEGTVGAKRYIESRVAYEQAKIRLLTYGLQETTIANIESGTTALPLGQFQLFSPIEGTILVDEFRLGERLTAGQTAFVVSDESSIWVEAFLTPGAVYGIEKGTEVRVKLADSWHSGVVVQRHHLLDERTRTIPVRIELELPEGEDHHRGEFGQVEFTKSLSEPLLSVPESALVRDAEGRWVVFIEEEPNHFTSVPVIRGEVFGERVSIQGIQPGSVVVITGAFFLSAELAKGGFDVHGH